MCHIGRVWASSLYVRERDAVSASASAAKQRSSSEAAAIEVGKGSEKHFVFSEILKRSMSCADSDQRR
jgi:hypothetical protein